MQTEKAKCFIFICVALVTLMQFSCTAGSVKQDKLTVLALQPFEDFDSSLVSLIIDGLKQTYVFDSIAVFPALELPSSAYYAPRQRYRAEKLIAHLDSINGGDRWVLGLTASDISTTKGEYEDWGIFGQALLGGQIAVVSTHRLGRGKVPDSLFTLRLQKITIHEIGHNLGLTHCPDTSCVMTDAKGKIATVDTAHRELCTSCRQKLQQH